MAPENPSITPQGESLRQALRWLASERAADKDAPRSKLIEQACVRFDLSPLDAEFLLRNFEAH